MPNATKVERVAELKEQIEGANALLLTEYRGLTVEEITELRRSLREVDASLAVIKNTLMLRAANDAGIAELDEMFAGPSAVAFVNGDDVVAVAKKLKEASKKFPALVIKGGYMDGAALDAAGAQALADLESREVMLSKIAGMLKSEMSHAAALFVGAQSKFLSLLEAYKAKLPGEEEPAAAAEPEPQTEEAPSAEADADTAAPDAAEASEAAEETPQAVEAEATDAEPQAEEQSETTNESTEEE